MRDRIIEWLVVGMVLSTAVEAQAQLRCVNELSGPGAFLGLEVRFETTLGSNPEYVGVLGLPEPDASPFLLAVGVSFVEGRNNVPGGTGDVVWWAFEPVVEYWTDAVLNDRVQLSPGVGLSFNYVDTLRSPGSFKTGGIVRGTVRIHFVPNKFALDLGLQGIALAQVLEPDDFAPGATGEAFERFIPAGFVNVRLNF